MTMTHERAREIANSLARPDNARLDAENHRDPIANGKQFAPHSRATGRESVPFGWANGEVPGRQSPLYGMAAPNGAAETVNGASSVGSCRVAHKRGIPKARGGTRDDLLTGLYYGTLLVFLLWGLYELIDQIVMRWG